MKMGNAFWARMLAFGLVLLIAVTVVLVLNVNSFEISLSYLALLAAVVIVGLMTNTRTGVVVSVVSIFVITLINRYSNVYVPETPLVNTAVELIGFFLVGLVAGRLGRTIGQIQRQANHWQAQAEAYNVHDKRFGTLKPAWAEVRLKEETMRANQFSRPLSAILLQIDPESDASPNILSDRTAVLQAAIRLSRSLTQPPAVVTCLDENQVLLILPEYTGDQANELGQRLSDQLATALYFPDKETKSLGIAVSQWGRVNIGVASLNGQGLSAEMLLTQAGSELTEISLKHRTNGTTKAMAPEKAVIRLAVGQISE
jgi:GGDEF domain-containing protein